jgi:hypothetical protein
MGTPTIKSRFGNYETNQAVADTGPAVSQGGFTT